MTSVAC